MQTDQNVRSHINKTHHNNNNGNNSDQLTIIPNSNVIPRGSIARWRFYFCFFRWCVVVRIMWSPTTISNNERRNTQTGRTNGRGKMERERERKQNKCNNSVCVHLIGSNNVLLCLSLNDGRGIRPQIIIIMLNECCEYTLCALYNSFSLSLVSSVYNSSAALTHRTIVLSTCCSVCVFVCWCTFMLLFALALSPSFSFANVFRWTFFFYSIVCIYFILRYKRRAARARQSFTSFISLPPFSVRLYVKCVCWWVVHPFHRCLNI